MMVIRSLRSSRERGCTLIEMFFLIGIMTILASLIGVIVHMKLESSRSSNTKFLLVHGARAMRQELPPYPWRNTLWQSGPQPASCREILIWYRWMHPSSPGILDAWGTPMYVACAQGPSGPRLAIYSSGPDRRSGTQDDLGVPLYPEPRSYELRLALPAVVPQMAAAAWTPARLPGPVLFGLAAVLPALWLVRRGVRRIPVLRARE